MTYHIRHNGICDAGLAHTTTHKPFEFDFIVGGTDTRGNPVAKIGNRYIVNVESGTILFDRHIHTVESLNEQNQATFTFRSVSGFVKEGRFSVTVQELSTSIVLGELVVSVETDQQPIKKPPPIPKPIAPPLIPETEIIEQTPSMFRPMLVIALAFVLGMGFALWMNFGINAKPTIALSGSHTEVLTPEPKPVLQIDHVIIETKTSPPAPIPIVTLPPTEVTRTIDPIVKPIVPPPLKKTPKMRTWGSTCEFIDCR